MRLSEVERMLIDLENRVRVIEGRDLAKRSYKAPQERDILLKEPIKNPEPIKVEDPRELKMPIEEMPEATEEPIEEEADKKILKEEEIKEAKMSGTPERPKEEGEKDVFVGANSSKEKEKPSVEQPKDLKPKEDIKEDTKPSTAKVEKEVKR